MTPVGDAGRCDVLRKSRFRQKFLGKEDWINEDIEEVFAEKEEKKAGSSEGENKQE
jgi:hypothetical protein